MLTLGLSLLLLIVITRAFPKRLQADALSTFPYFGVKLVVAYRMHARTPKASAGRRFEHVSYFGVELVAAYHKHTDTPKTSAGRRFEHFFILWG